MFILDTNTLIYFFKGQGRVAENLIQHSPQDIAIPTIVLYELQVGIKKSTSPQKRIKQLNEFVSAINVMPFDQAEAESAALIRATLEKKGQPIGPYDILIAATALANKATLITHNLKEFSRIDNLSLADWL